MVAFVSLKPERIFQAVEEMYTAVAREPAREFHFPIGRAACLAVGYPEAELRGLPEKALESFAGVGYPYRAGVVQPGDVVLDIGSGSGTDTLIASRRVGPSGKVYALDMTAAMRAKLAAILKENGVTNVEILAGNAEAIPLPDNSVDVVTSNGVLNLVPDKPRAFAEIFRVLKPGGRLQIADIALARPIADKYRRDPTMWAECVVGAVPEEKYLEMLRAVGLTDVQPIDHLDFFSLSRSADTRTVANLFGAHALLLRARKPLHAVAAPQPPAVHANPGWKTLAKETIAMTFAGAAYALCSALPALLSAATAAGALALVRHEYLYAVYIVAVGLSLWLHYSTARAQGYFPPSFTAAAFGVSGIAVFGLLLAGFMPALWWWPYAALAGMIGASLWSVLRGWREDCVTQMVREAQRETRSETF